MEVAGARRQFSGSSLKASVKEMSPPTIKVSTRNMEGTILMRQHRLHCENREVPLHGVGLPGPRGGGGAGAHMGGGQQIFFLYVLNIFELF